jgi:uncharacterized integral membrane protein (TIGR00697 family)
MVNELIFFVTVAIELFFLIYMLRLGKQGLVAIIVVNIILVSCFGALLVPLFGFTTNAGNVFYAVTFLAAQMMVERYGREVAAKSVWIGFGALVIFVLMAQYSIRLTGISDNNGLAQAMHQVFSAVPRVACASMAAYLISQNLNIWLFASLRKKHAGRQLWVRSLLSTAAGQLIDSLVFFSIAFVGVLSSRELAQTMLVGLGAKVLVGIIGIPALYLGAAVARSYSHSERLGAK